VDDVPSFFSYLYHEDKLVTRWNLACEILYGYRSRVWPYVRAKCFV